MDLEIFPHIGVGNIRFNMPRDEVQKRIKGPFRTVRTSTLRDYYHDIGVFCGYDSADLLEYMEFASPARPVIAGMEFLGLPFREAFDMLRVLDSTVEADNNGATSFRFGVGMWNPAGKKNLEEPVETVIAFRPGYYDVVPPVVPGYFV